MVQKPKGVLYTSLDPLKVLFNFAPRQPEHYGAAMWADSRIGSGAKLVENVHHFLVCQRIVGLYGCVAGGCGRKTAERFLNGCASIEPFEIVSEGEQRL